MRGSNTRVVVVGVGVALLIGMVVANFAVSTPDAFQRAVVESACQDAADEEACLAEKEGEPVVVLAPGALLDYANVPLSGLVGAVVAFAVGSALVFLLRLSRRDGGRAGDSGGAGPAP